MDYNKEKDQWMGTPIEHLQKLLDTHNCLCNKARMLIQGIIDGKTEIEEAQSR